MGLKTGFSLPLGPFQIHLPSTVILPAARRMGDALERLRVAIDSSQDIDEFGRIASDDRPRSAQHVDRGRRKVFLPNEWRLVAPSRDD